VEFVAPNIKQFIYAGVTIEGVLNTLHKRMYIASNTVKQFINIEFYLNYENYHDDMFDDDINFVRPMILMVFSINKLRMILNVNGVEDIWRYFLVLLIFCSNIANLYSFLNHLYFNSVFLSISKIDDHIIWIDLKPNNRCSVRWEIFFKENASY